MEVRIKTLKNGEFIVEVDPSGCVGDIKAQIQKAHGFDVDTQVLICKGRTIGSHELLSDIHMAEHESFLLFVKEPEKEAAAQKGTNLLFLSGDPQFRALRNVVLKNPELLEPIVEQIGKDNPKLRDLIKDNYGEFLERLESEAWEETDNLETQYVEVSPKEKEAVDRLVSLGFERARVLEVFFACGRSEALAANTLIDYAYEK